MSFRTTSVALMLVAATALVAAPGAAACQPSPYCVVEGGYNLARECASAAVDCAVMVAKLPGALVNAYLDYVHGVYCDTVGVGC